MNKILTGAVAGAAGVALLLGGAGTFALWNTTAVVNSGSIASGTLNLVAGATSWRDISPDKTAATISAIGSFKIVPGDKLELTQVITVNATGNNLAATLSVDDASITGALKSSLTPIVVTATGTGVTAGTVANTFAVTPQATATTVTVKVIIELPSTVSGATAQAQSLDLSVLGFKLAQNVR